LLPHAGKTPNAIPLAVFDQFRKISRDWLSPLRLAGRHVRLAVARLIGQIAPAKTQSACVVQL
jgi:hypothetical protein